jgi:hypothetical protein
VLGQLPALPAVILVGCGLIAFAWTLYREISADRAETGTPPAQPDGSPSGLSGRAPSACITHRGRGRRS